MHIDFKLKFQIEKRTKNRQIVAGNNMPKKLFSCQLCGKVLCSKASLKRHIADKHAVRQEEYRCIICERVYCSRNSLMTHIYTYHKSRPGEMDIKDIKLYNQHSHTFQTNVTKLPRFSFYHKTRLIKEIQPVRLKITERRLRIIVYKR